MVSEADFKVKCEKMTSERTKFWLKFQPIPMYLSTAVPFSSGTSGGGKSGRFNAVLNYGVSERLRAVLKTARSRTVHSFTM